MLQYHACSYSFVKHYLGEEEKQRAIGAATVFFLLIEYVYIYFSMFPSNLLKLIKQTRLQANVVSHPFFLFSGSNCYIISAISIGFIANKELAM